MDLTYAVFGDIREDGLRYGGLGNYRKDGTRGERWHSPASWKRIKEWNVKYFREYNHGVSHDVFESMRIAQNNACAICNTCFDTLNSKQIHIDHNHTTGIVRAILCGQCNLMIGASRESTDIMSAGIRYLNLY